MRTRLAALALTVLLAGCQSTTGAMNTWLGAPESRLLAAWGAPDHETSSGENRVLTWDGRNGYGQIICRKTFVVAGGTVHSASNNCPL